MHKGSCLCGGVRFEVAGDLAAPDACHCTQCRKTSGHYFASTDVARSALAIYGAENVAWYGSSNNVRRGFCKTCGSTLFWDPLDRDWTGIAMGAFDRPTNTHIHVHIYVGDKGDYYEIADRAPQYETTPPRPQ